MFDQDQFNVLLYSNHMTKEQLARELGISTPTLYRKIKDSGNFSKKEIDKLNNKRAEIHRKFLK